jgi:hypothetical protein
VAVLLDLLLRISFGLVTAMASIPARWVDSGFFRVHLYVALGLYTLASLVARSHHPGMLLPAVALAAMAFVGATMWLLERQTAGRLSLVVIAAGGLAVLWPLSQPPADSFASACMLWRLTPPVSGLLMGTALAAMLLGHWYLNSPSMQLTPLYRLILMLMILLLARGILAGTGLAWALRQGESLSAVTWWLVLMRWAAGLAGAAVLSAMVWQTLKIPNTQSATGILYVTFVGVLAGELISRLLSTSAVYPL